MFRREHASPRLIIGRRYREKFWPSTLVLVDGGWIVQFMLAHVERTCICLLVANNSRFIWGFGGDMSRHAQDALNEALQTMTDLAGFLARVYQQEQRKEDHELVELAIDLVELAGRDSQIKLSSSQFSEVKTVS